MKHASNQRRGRSRGNGKRQPQGKNRNFESSGPEAKVRGSAQQVLDKYLAMARDAMSSGDRIAAEGYLQHAEHYYRILNDQPQESKGGQNRNRDQRQSGQEQSGQEQSGQEQSGQEQSGQEQPGQRQAPAEAAAAEQPAEEPKAEAKPASKKASPKESSKSADKQEAPSEPKTASA